MSYDANAYTTYRVGITKRGDRYLRTQLIHAGRAAKKWACNQDDQLSLWLKQLEKRVGTHKATVAIAPYQPTTYPTRLKINIENT